MTGMLTDAELAALPEKARAVVIALGAQLETLETERAERGEMQARIEALETVNARLEHIVAEFKKLLFGKRSEKLDPDQRHLPFEDLEAAAGMLARRRQWLADLSSGSPDVVAV